MAALFSVALLSLILPSPCSAAIRLKTNNSLRVAGDEAVAEDVAPPTIVVSQHSRKWWGFPNYLNDLDSGLRTWAEFARAHGHKGRTCTQETTRQRCGDAFVCNADAGVCAECEMSKDCGEKFLCQSFPVAPSKEGFEIGRNLCIPRDLLAQWNYREVIATVLIIITAMFSAAAGMGGGGVYVPLLLLLLGLSTKEAVPLSQTMIVGGAVINIIMFCGDRNPKFPSRSKIDYDVIMMLNPGLAAGVTIGVILNVMSPQWLIVMVLIVTLVITLEKSWKKGVSSWKKESAAFAEQGEEQRAKVAAKVQIKLAPDLRSCLELVQDNKKNIMLIFGLWCVFFLINMVKAQQCTPMYWMQVFALLAMSGVFTQAGAKIIMERAGSKETVEGVLEWTPQTLWLYPLMAVVAGFLGGFLGIGGGIIMGPLLLELGMLPEASQATSAMFVFLSSSLATIQFYVMGKGMPAYVAWFTTWVVLATFVGQTLIDYMLRCWQRSSLIVLSIAAIIAGSLVMMTLIGVKDVYTDLARGANMGFQPHMLCQ